MRSEVIDGPAGPVEVYVEGDGHPVVMLPSLGRGAEVARMLLGWLDLRITGASA